MLGLHCNVQAAHCGSFSCHGAQASGAQGLSSCNTQALELRLGSHVTWPLLLPACGIFLNQGLNPRPCTGRQILIHCTTKEVLHAFF